MNEFFLNLQGLEEMASPQLVGGGGEGTDIYCNSPVGVDSALNLKPPDLIDLVTVFDAILTSRQTREKLQCLYENLMSNNFRKTAVLKKISIVN